MMEFLKIVAGGCILFAICFTIICMLDIPAYLKRLKKKAIYEFDFEHNNTRYHVAVLEKFQHHFGTETFRRLRIEFVHIGDMKSYDVYERFVDEKTYVDFLKLGRHEED